jgi:hypothetical protein
MHIKIHFISQRKFFENFSELFQFIENSDTSTAVEIVGLDEPDVGAVVHFFVEGEFSTHSIFIFTFRLVFTILQNIMIYFLELFLHGFT